MDHAGHVGSAIVTLCGTDDASMRTGPYCFSSQASSIPACYIVCGVNKFMSVSHHVAHELEAGRGLLSD